MYLCNAIIEQFLSIIINMKKLFTLMAMLSLLGVKHAWAGDDLIFFGTGTNNMFHNIVKPRASVDEVASVDCYFRYYQPWNGYLKTDDYVNYIFKAEIIGDLTMDESSALQDGEERGDFTAMFTIKFKGRGGAIVVSATNKNYNSNGWSTFFVITAPYIGNQTWDFFTDPNTEMTNYHVNGGYDYWKGTTKFSGHSDRPIKVVDMDYDKGSQYRNDGHDNIDGTNARYIPATAGLIFTCADEGFGVNDNSNNSNAKRYVVFGKRGKLTIPHLKGGTYVRIWWDAINAGEFGGNFLAEGLLDLDGNNISNGFTISGVTDYGVCQGNTIFKVAGNSNQYYDVSLTLNDDGWNDLYKIQVMDQYETDMILADGTAGWNDMHTVLYNNDYATIVHDGTGVRRMYSGHSGKSHIQRARTVEWDVTSDGNVTYTKTFDHWTHDGNAYYDDLILNITGGTGNIKIIQREKFNGYTLDMNESWLAVGTYTQQRYPYTWDFTEYNVLRPDLHLLTWLGNTNDNNIVRYGHWIEESGSVFNLENHELVDGTIRIGQTDQYEKVHRPLFAQGSQLTNGETALNETKGLRVKQYIRKDGEDHIAVGEEYDGEIKMDGTALKFTPNTPSDPNYDHRLKITIPQVENGMYVFVKANHQPNVYKGNTQINSNTTYANASDVGAYAVSGKGDIDLYFDQKQNIEIYSIGVTNITKPVNKYGYATESRDRVIDHTYTGKFTSNDVNAYIMKNYDGTQVTMVETDVIAENTGIVMYKSDNTTQFNAPLFVNACNVTADATDGNLLKPNVTASILDKTSGNYTNFVLTDISYHIKDMTSKPLSGEENIGFYRVGQSGTLGANKSYLQLPTSDLNTEAGAKGVVFLLWDDEEEITGITTQIDDASLLIDNGQLTTGHADWYNLNGQKLSGKPSANGLYIMNGKKVLVK